MHVNICMPVSKWFFNKRVHASRFGLECMLDRLLNGFVHLWMTLPTSLFANSSLRGSCWITQDSRNAHHVALNFHGTWFSQLGLEPEKFAATKFFSFCIYTIIIVYNALMCKNCFRLMLQIAQSAKIVCLKNLVQYCIPGYMYVTREKKFL